MSGETKSAAWVLYPADWPKCAHPKCGEPARDGHLTCGNAACGPESHYQTVSGSLIPEQPSTIDLWPRSPIGEQQYAQRPWSGDFEGSKVVGGNYREIELRIYMDLLAQTWPDYINPSFDAALELERESCIAIADAVCYLCARCPNCGSFVDVIYSAEWRQLWCTNARRRGGIGTTCMWQESTNVGAPLRSHDLFKRLIALGKRCSTSEQRMIPEEAIEPVRGVLASWAMSVLAAQARSEDPDPELHRKADLVAAVVRRLGRTA